MNFHGDFFVSYRRVILQLELLIYRKPDIKREDIIDRRVAEVVEE